MTRARAWSLDRNDLTFYDMVVNLEQIRVEDACAIVCEAVRRGFQTTPESQAQLADYCFASEIQARIGLDGGIPEDGVQIAAKEGVVTVTGTVTSVQDADKVRKLVRSTNGVKDVVSKMTVRR